jgi:hypothetical protein
VDRQADKGVDMYFRSQERSHTGIRGSYIGSYSREVDMQVDRQDRQAEWQAG